jgi:hypothetical protein
MARLTLRTVVEAVDRCLATVKWMHRSSFAATNFPADPDGWAHGSYVVEAPSTTWPGAATSRVRRPGLAGFVETAIRVRYLWALPELSQWEAYLASLDAEADVLIALTRAAGGVESSDGIHLDVRSVPTRVTIGDGRWLAVEILGVATHTLEIQ